MISLTNECVGYEDEKREIEQKLAELDKSSDDYARNARRTRDALEETVNVLKAVRVEAAATHKKLQAFMEENKFEAGESLTLATGALAAGDAAGISATA